MCEKYGRYMVVFAVGAALTAAADTYTWTNALGDGDWSKPGNFLLGPEGTGSVPETVPDADDNVYVEANTTVTLDYDPDDAAKLASCNAFAGVWRVRPRANTTFNITVKEGEVFPLSCSISLGTSEANYIAGHIVKLGKGELDLNCVGVNVSGDYYDYYCELTVEDGAVRLPQSGVDDHYHLGRVTVNGDGKLFIANSGTSNSTELYELFGDGTVTNDNATSSRLKITNYGEFSGRIGGTISYYSSGLLLLTGTDSTFASGGSQFIVYQNFGNGVSKKKNGCAELVKIGTKAVDGVSVPSSVGFAETLLVRDNGGAFRYIGSGETTDKDLRIWSQATPYETYLDGGPHGGLVWTGLWGHRDTDVSTYQHRMQRLVLQGSNVEECVMSGVIEAKTQHGTNYTFCITKQGTGTWRMAHNNSSRMHGVWRVINGTLRYDTIAEAGKNTALGSSTMLYKNLGGVLALDENKVDYAFLLGGGTSGNRANLEYVGATNCVSTTRRFAVNGTGGILNSGGGFLRLSDFFATNTASTLVLGGTNRLDNVADCIADGGNAQMSVVKEGSGTWRLGTNCTFTGSLDVKGGRLEIGNSLYEYYRWVVKESFYGSATRDSSRSQMFGLCSFGLFDADGNDRTYGITDEGEYYTDTYYTSYGYGRSNVFADGTANVANVAEGRARVTAYDGSSRMMTWSDYGRMADLFLHKKYGGYVWSRSPQLPPWHESTNTWMVFTIHPVKGAPITSWDFVNVNVHNAAATSNNKSYQIVKMCELQASADGKQWDSLQSLDYDGYGAEYRPTEYTWRSDNSTPYEEGYTTHTTGMPIPPGPTNAVKFAASSVSVAAGAELVARAPEKPIIRALTVDGSAGGGTIDGFAFASDLTLSIDNVASAAGLTIPMTLRNVEGLNASDWTVSVGGKVKASLRVSASANGLTITPTGMQFLIR